MASSFCPKCGTPRVGALRFCPSCKLDFHEIDRAAGAGAVPQAPASNAPASPQSYSEKYAGTPWAATPAATTTVEPGNRRSPRGVIAILGIVSVGAVMGLALILATGGLGVRPPAPSSTTMGATSATEQPTGAPTPSPVPTDMPLGKEAAGKRYLAFVSAANKADIALQKKHIDADGYYRSLAAFRAYWAGYAAITRGFADDLRSVVWPVEFKADFQLMFRHAAIAEAAALMAAQAQTWEEADRLSADAGEATKDTTNTSNLIRGDLGLPSVPLHSARATPGPAVTSRPTPKPTPASGWTQAARTAAATYRRSVSQTYDVDLTNAVAGLRSVSSCTTEEECYYAGQEQRTYIRLATDVLKAHLADMKANPAASCFRDAYAKDQSLAKSWLEFLPTWSVSSSGNMRYFMQMLAIYASETNAFLSAFNGYFRDCK